MTAICTVYDGNGSGFPSSTTAAAGAHKISKTSYRTVIIPGLFFEVYLKEIGFKK
jgi:hypothetical protein